MSFDDCSKLVIPDGEVNTVLDKQNGAIKLSWLDDQSGIDKEVYVKTKDNSCSDSVKKEVSHVLQSDAEVQVTICKSMKEEEINNVTEVRGKKVNGAARKKYISEWCS